MPILSPSCSFSLTRRFSTAAALYDGNRSKGGTESNVISDTAKKEVAGETQLGKGSSASRLHRELEARITPSALTKRVLVWMRLYESRNAIPKQITQRQYTKVRTWMRLRFGAFTMIAVFISCHFVIQKGKIEVAEERLRQNILWHRNIEEKYQASINRDDKK